MCINSLLLAHQTNQKNKSLVIAQKAEMLCLVQQFPSKFNNPLGQEDTDNLRLLCLGYDTGWMAILSIFFIQPLRFTLFFEGFLKINVSFAYNNHKRQSFSDVFSFSSFRFYLSRAKRASLKANKFIWILCFFVKKLLQKNKIKNIFWQKIVPWRKSFELWKVHKLIEFISKTRSNSWNPH